VFFCCGLNGIKEREGFYCAAMDVLALGQYRFNQQLQ
jgi:hypothetical protein